MVNEENVKGVDKVERYDWKIIDEPVKKVTWVPKERLIIPEGSYQRREMSEGKSLRIAREFSWIAFQVISVAFRDGVYYVVDGGHRLRAVLKRSDIKDVPCLVFQSHGEKDEAAAFGKINGERKPMDGVDRHRAAVVAGDPVATTLDRLMVETGRRIERASGPKSVRCINDLRKLYIADSEVFLRIWPLVIEVCAGHNVHQMVPRAFFYLEKYGTHSIVSGRWAKRIKALGYDEVLSACNQGAAFFNQRSTKPWAIGLMNQMNKGRHKKFEIRTGA